jgi:hypothetical protein
MATTPMETRMQQEDTTRFCKECKRDLSLSLFNSGKKRLFCRMHFNMRRNESRASKKPKNNKQDTQVNPTYEEERKAAHDRGNKLLHGNKMALSFICTGLDARFCLGCDKDVSLDKFDPGQTYHLCTEHLNKWKEVLRYDDELRYSIEEGMFFE